MGEDIFYSRLHLASTTSSSRSSVYETDGSRIPESEPPTPDGSGLPPNFAEVLPGLYRSSYPLAAHFEKLGAYHFKTVVTLVGQEYPDANSAFNEKNGVQHYQIPFPAHKDPLSIIPAEDMKKVLLILLDEKNYPLLVHCNKGKHRTGCAIACLRKVQGWSPTMIIDEYRNFSAPKSRPLDEAFINAFDCNPVNDAAEKADVPISKLPTPPNSDRMDGNGLDTVEKLLTL